MFDKSMMEEYLKDKICKENHKWKVFNVYGKPTIDKPLCLIGKEEFCEHCDLPKRIENDLKEKFMWAIDRKWNKSIPEGIECLNEK